MLVIYLALAPLVLPQRLSRHPPCSSHAGLLAPHHHAPYPIPLAGHKAPSWSSCARQLLATSYFTFGSVYMSILLFHFIPAYPFLSPCPQVHSLPLRLYSSPAPRFIRTILFLFFFRFRICVFAYGICFSLSDFLHSSVSALGKDPSLPLSSFCWFPAIFGFPWL